MTNQLPCIWPSCGTESSSGADMPLCTDHVVGVVRFAFENRLHIAAGMLASLHPEVFGTEEQVASRKESSDQRQWILGKVARAGSVVYYVQLRPGIIKIGVTIDLVSRIKSFRLPPEAVLAAEPGNQRVETLRHRKFAEFRADRPGSREEYETSSQLTAWIKGVRSRHGDPYELHRNLKLAALMDLDKNGPALHPSNEGIYEELASREVGPIRGAA